MPFEDLKVRLALLLEQMTHQPEDWHEAQETIREEISELRAQGLTPPADLVKLEEELEERLNLPKR